MNTMALDACRSAIGRHSGALLGLSHSIHAEPELAFAEHRSAAKVAELAQQHGFTVTAPVAGLDTAFTARRGSGDLVVGLCAEYDALPGIGHACGHNVIAAASTAAALALGSIADELGISVLLIGTPAEESGGGKVLMLERGVFDEVSLAMMVHPAPHETVNAPSLAIAELDVRYTGRESHAAMAPELGRNAADALTVAQVAVGLARQHLEPRQMVHGIVTRGGSAPNVVPADTAASYYLRAADVDSLRRLEGRIRDCFAAGALATGCTHEVRHACPVYTELVPDEWLARAYRESIGALGRIPLPPERAAGLGAASTDMGNVTRALPAIHPTIAIDAGGAVNHQPEFAAACVSTSADAAVLDGGLALAATAIAAAQDHEQRARLLADRAPARPGDAGGTP